jgi:hypothetical protein
LVLAAVFIGRLMNGIQGRLNQRFAIPCRVGGDFSLQRADAVTPRSRPRFYDRVTSGAPVLLAARTASTTGSPASRLRESESRHHAKPLIGIATLALFMAGPPFSDASARQLPAGRGRYFS